MISLSQSPTPARALWLVTLVLLAGCSTPPVTPPSAPAPTQTKPQAAAPAAAAPGAYDDDPRPLNAMETAIAEAGLDAAKLAAAQASLLAILQDAKSTPAAAQDAAQQLGYVLLAAPASSHAATLNALAPMLADPARSDFARLALDPIPGEAVDTLYLQALLSSSGRTRLGLIDAAGTRGLAGAVPVLASLLGDGDRATADASAAALGRIGGGAALAALARAKVPLAPVIVKARLAAAAKADTATAAQVAGEIHATASLPPGLRAAALRQLIAAKPDAAVETIDAALAGSEPAFHAVAIESIHTLPAADASARLAARLPSYAPGVQFALAAALGYRGDAAAVPGLVAALDSAPADVRLATLDSLGRLPGSPDVARRLATLAAGQGDEAKAAAAALTRLDGPGLDDLVRQSAAAEENEALRVVFLQQIAARNLTEAIPFLFSLRTTASETLRLEALDALRLIAPPSEQAGVIAWATGATSRTEQNRAVRALITMILRDGAVGTRAAPVLAALESGDAAARAVLMPVLSRAAGAPALATAGKLARDGNEAVALGATAELARWPDASALPVLVDLAVSTSNETVRAAAAQGASRFLTQAGNASPAERSARARALLGLPLSTPSREALISVLSLCADPEALAVAQRFASDPALAAVARDAVDAITSNLAGRPVVTSSVTAEDPAIMADGSTETFWQVPANEPGTWIRADLHSSRPVRRIFLNHRGRGWGYPGDFIVQVSDQPDQPGEAVLTTEGERNETAVSLPAGVRGRYVWIRLTGRRDAPLAISELRVE
jgi:hypothetical protein